MVKPPEHIVPGSTVPETAQKHRDEKISVSLYESLTITPQRDVEVVA